MQCSPCLVSISLLFISLLFTPDPQIPLCHGLCPFFRFGRWCLFSVLVVYVIYRFSHISQLSISLLFSSEPPVGKLLRRQIKEQGVVKVKGASELLPWTAGPGARKNLDPEHPTRDGGTPRAVTLRSFYTSCLIQFVLCGLAVRISHPLASLSRTHPPALRRPFGLLCREHILCRERILHIPFGLRARRVMLYGLRR